MLQRRLKFGLLKGLLQDENFQNAFWRLKQVSNISILFQKQSMGHVGHFKFLKIFHYHLLKKCFRTAAEAFNLFVPKPQPIIREIPYIRLGLGDEKVKGSSEVAHSSFILGRKILKILMGIFSPPPNRALKQFFWTFFKIAQTKSFQWSIMYSKVNQRFLNTFLILFSHFKHFSTLHSTQKPWRPPKSLFLGLLEPIRRSKPLCHFWDYFSKLL